jgi:hypothetical protein
MTADDGRCLDGADASDRVYQESCVRSEPERWWPETPCVLENRHYGEMLEGGALSGRPAHRTRPRLHMLPGSRHSVPTRCLEVAEDDPSVTGGPVVRRQCVLVRLPGRAVECAEHEPVVIGVRFPDMTRQPSSYIVVRDLSMISPT